jgi:AdoMet-dependent heme synthase
VVTTTEAPQFRRIALQQQRREGRTAPDRMAARDGHSHAAGIRDGNGILFISHVGDVCPSGFMEVPAGNVREEDVLEIYRTAPLFRLLRDVDAFTGRCGACEYRATCGGSRARAYAATGNPLSEDPLCVYMPRALKRPA